jgi:hypothetical protein
MFPKFDTTLRCARSLTRIQNRCGAGTHAPSEAEALSERHPILPTQSINGQGTAAALPPPLLPLVNEAESCGF